MFSFNSDSKASPKNQYGYTPHAYTYMGACLSLQYSRNSGNPKASAINLDCVICCLPFWFSYRLSSCLCVLMPKRKTRCSSWAWFLAGRAWHLLSPLFSYKLKLHFEAKGRNAKTMPTARQHLWHSVAFLQNFNFLDERIVQGKASHIFIYVFTAISDCYRK